MKFTLRRKGPDKPRGSTRTTLVDAVREAVDDTVAEIRRTAPKDTGALRASFRAEETADGAIARSRLRYSGFVRRRVPGLVLVRGEWKQILQRHMQRQADRYVKETAKAFLGESMRGLDG